MNAERLRRAGRVLADMASILLLPLLLAWLIVYIVLELTMRPLYLAMRLLFYGVSDRLFLPYYQRRDRLLLAANEGDEAFMARQLAARKERAQGLARRVAELEDVSHETWGTVVLLGAMLCVALMCLAAFFQALVLWRQRIAVGAALWSESMQLSLAVGGALWAILMASWGSITSTNRFEATLARRALTLEGQRVRDVAELAGGLTLAESIGDDALVGALSGDGAQRGELEQVGEG
jgi:predicted branched-subunit amino acid permease